MSMDTSGLASLMVAFALSSSVRFRTRAAAEECGARTHTLVGVGAALFTLAGYYGFGRGRPASMRRVSLPVVTGISFIGAGVIFLRRDGVQGLDGGHGLADRCGRRCSGSRALVDGDNRSVDLSDSLHSCATPLVGGDCLRPRTL